VVTYRVEKDGITFYVQPEMLDYYASNGYKIYKTIEKQVADIAVEIAAIDESKPQPVIKEVTING
jgi:hypothetical protein